MRAAAEGKAIKIFESNLGTITFSVFDAWFVDREIKGQQCPGLFKLKQNKQNEMRKNQHFKESPLTWPKRAKKKQTKCNSTSERFELPRESSQLISNQSP